MGNANDRTAADPGLRPRRRWLGRLIPATISLVTLTGAVIAMVALMNAGRPNTYRVHMVTDLFPRRQAIAEQLRAEGTYRGTDEQIHAANCKSINPSAEGGTVRVGPLTAGRSRVE